ncbi:MAG: patatin-like phospholipase family protein [Saprospiraceae bacterium]|jgi:NTE family protein|nr:patatin-like phospholipase family protein [Saprospiraceae bacterium]
MDEKMDQMRKDEYEIGLVLSGGGFRGAAHIGVIKAMQEAGIKANVISGVSAGALIGACYASGLSCEAMLSLFTKPKLFSLAHYSYKKPGLLDTDKFTAYLDQYISQNNYEELEIPLYISATDMLSGKLVTFYNGNLNKPILASCAFPFVFSPVWHNDTYYSDGGIINNFPVEPLIGKCKTIIGVYVNPMNELPAKELNTSIKVLQRAFSISTSSVPYLKFQHCDIVIEPKALSKYNLFDRRNVHKIYELGYEEGKKMLEKININEIQMQHLDIK